MNIEYLILSRKYAVAFLNLFINEITLEDYHALVKLLLFLKNKPELNLMFKLPRVEKAKREAIDCMMKEFQLPLPFKKLMDLLLDDQRLFLLLDVLRYIKQLYTEREGIMEFEIRSSHDLNHEQLEIIKYFLSSMTGKHIVYKHSIDRELIAGIRLQSDILLWERSVAQKLAEAQRSLPL
jgi:ATP synthase F1 delta subunit